MIIETGGGPAGPTSPRAGFTSVEGAPATPTIYTLTNGSSPDGDPTSWRLEASAEGTTWSVLDERTNQSFPWRRQTRPFTIPTPAEHQHYRLTLTTSAGPLTLTQLELLA